MTIHNVNRRAAVKSRRKRELPFLKSIAFTAGAAFGVFVSVIASRVSPFVALGMYIGMIAAMIVGMIKDYREWRRG